MMIKLGFTKKDLVRACWGAFIGAVVGLAVALQAGVTDWTILSGAALGGAISALKNFVLADGSTLKG